VIIGIESNLFRVIGTDNIVRSLAYTQIIKREESKPISVFDKDLKVGDYVREIDGEVRNTYKQYHLFFILYLCIHI